MMSKCAVIPLTIGALLAALLLPVMAQDATPTSDPAETLATAVPTVAAPAPLTASTDLFVTSQFRVNVRSGPGIEYTRIGILTFADSLDITGQNADATWLQVDFNGREGWIAASVVEVNGDLESAPVVEAGEDAVLISSVTPSAPAASGEVAVITAYNTNLRSSFSIDSELLLMIPYGTELVPEGRTNDSTWLMVTYEDQTGWVYAPIVFFARGNVETLPVMGTITTPEPAAEAVVPAPEATEPVS